MEVNVINLTLAQGVELELVRIPAGEFWMGSDIWSYNEKPKHRLSLPEYWMGKYLVTIAQYAAFIRATGYETRPRLHALRLPRFQRTG
jgi:formylglycine-generating enzyme required for sulfatase activity